MSDKEMSGDDREQLLSLLATYGPHAIVGALADQVEALGREDGDADRATSGAAGLRMAAQIFHPDAAFQELRRKAIKKARELHAEGSDDEIEVDDNAGLSDALPEGVWVQAVVWVRGSDIGEGDEAEEAEEADHEAGSPECPATFNQPCYIGAHNADLRPPNPNEG